jgi:hypothetical protein
LQSAVNCANHLRQAGMEVPEWHELADGLRPKPPDLAEREPGIFAHGWQFYAAKSVDTVCRDNLLGRLSPAHKACLRSQSGPGAGAALTAVLTSPLLQIEPHLFRTILLRRLRLPLSFVPATCRCRQFLDSFGDHRASCAVSGILVRRAVPMESALARVFREAGGRVRTNVFVRDLNIGIGRAGDGRRIEVIADGLPLFHGVQLAIDGTIVCALHADGTPHPGCANLDGATLDRARRKKEIRYPELIDRHGRARLVVFGAEVGGRWSAEAWKCLGALARSRTRDDPDILRASATMAWHRR